eukprot:TRINITY_DN6613_c0_g1_i4.p2 TRINITY_DN6613_c0_g1~~TRINITY_DN6613_c0_g1_i4.p2  ORF type:complete len:134 (+),score=36.55 TRINITY_DN6613_c0_g1_i4:83-484(+)
MIRRPPRSTHCISSAASDVYKRQGINAEYMGQFYFMIAGTQQKAKYFYQSLIECLIAFILFFTSMFGLKKPSNQLNSTDLRFMEPDAASYLRGNNSNQDPQDRRRNYEQYQNNLNQRYRGQGQTYKFTCGTGG